MPDHDPAKDQDPTKGQGHTQPEASTEDAPDTTELTDEQLEKAAGGISGEYKSLLQPYEGPDDAATSLPD